MGLIGDAIRDRGFSTYRGISNDDDVFMNRRDGRRFEQEGELILSDEKKVKKSKEVKNDRK